MVLTYISWSGILEYFRRSYFDVVSRIPDPSYYACRVLSQPYKTGRQKLHLSEKTQLWNVLSCTFLELLSCRKWCNSSKRWEKSGKKSGPPPDEERLLLIGCTNWPSVLLYVFNTSRCHLWVSFFTYLRHCCALLLPIILDWCGYGFQIAFCTS